jgi:hypothetical protein
MLDDDSERLRVELVLYLHSFYIEFRVEQASIVILTDFVGLEALIGNRSGRLVFSLGFVSSDKDSDGLNEGLVFRVSETVSNGVFLF